MCVRHRRSEAPDRHHEPRGRQPALLGYAVEPYQALLRCSAMAACAAQTRDIAAVAIVSKNTELVKYLLDQGINYFTLHCHVRTCLSVDPTLIMTERAFRAHRRTVPRLSASRWRTSSGRFVVAEVLAFGSSPNTRRGRCRGRPRARSCCSSTTPSA